MSAICYEGVPIGYIMVWMYGNQIPENYLACDGKEVSPVEYPKLYNILCQQYSYCNAKVFLPKITSIFSPKSYYNRIYVLDSISLTTNTIYYIIKAK